MDIFSVITLFGGLAFFLYGMTTLSNGLERMAGGKLERMLKKVTSGRLLALFLGIGITAAIQSSSAVTVMLVGLVNSGIMSLGQSIGVIMGSNIGTTLTAWILTLVGIESGNPLINLLKPENFSLVFAFVGILMIMSAKSSRKKDTGSILVGFAVLMYGMKLMSSAVGPLSEIPAFTSLLTAFKNPLLGVLAGTVITAVIQSSSASVGILQALALTGNVSFGAAIPIIMGQNIGTCVTAIISSIGVSKNAKKVSVVHITFNIIGTAICLSVYCILDAIFNFAFVDLPISPIGVAVVHSVFNIVTTAILLPASSLLEKFANKVMDKRADEEGAALIDTRLINTPSIAVSECDSLSSDMSACAHNTLLSALSLLDGYNEKIAEEILENENKLDKYEDELGTFLVKLSAKELSNADSQRVSKMLHSIGNFERLGDHAVNILNSSKELSEKGLSFSSSAKKEISVVLEAIKEISHLGTLAYKTNNVELAARIEPLEQAIDILVSSLKSQHIERLKKGDCSIELGFILSDLITDFERISDHYSNIAVSIVELSHNTFDTHKYLNSIKYGDQSFNKIYDEYLEKYKF